MMISNRVCVADRTKLPKGDDMTELMNDLDEMENLCIKMEDLPDIWQSRVIRTLCQVIRRMLVREAKRRGQ